MTTTLVNKLFKEFINEYHNGTWTTDEVAFEFKNEEAEQDWNDAMARYNSEDDQRLFKYAQEWAKLMTVARLRYDIPVSQSAERTAKIPSIRLKKYELDTAVDLLYVHWKRGEEVSQWYNSYRGK